MSARAPGRRRPWTGGVLVLLALAGVVSLTGDASGTPELPLVRSWVTTPDGRQLMAEQVPTAFADADAGGSAVTVAVDPRVRYQVVQGFGASITDSSAAVLYRLNQGVRDATMVRLFDPGRGAGLSYLRLPMGASDFVDEDPYTYDDVAPGRTDYALEHFSIAHDRAQILPLLRRARALNSQLRIVATPWSAPAWMKKTGSLIGGKLIDDPRIYQAYAQYFVRFLQAYAAAGVPVDAVTVQNEPAVSPDTYPGMSMSPAQQAAFVSVLGPALEEAGLGTSVLAYDDNWSAVTDTASGATTSADAYLARVLSDHRAARWVDGIAVHCYSGAVRAQADAHRMLPHAEILVSECSGYRRPGETSAAVFARELGTDARLVIDVTRNWAAGFLTWNLALGPQGGPHRGGCADCTGLVTVGPGEHVTYNAEYYVLASTSRVVRPGAVRVASTSSPLISSTGGLITTAFQNRDGTIALVVQNLAAAPRRFRVQEGGRSFTATAAGGSLTTFSWPGAARGREGGLPTG